MMDDRETRHVDDYNPDYDGRPPVGKFDRDPLLEALRRHHVIDAPRPCPNPGVPDDAGGSDR